MTAVSSVAGSRQARGEVRQQERVPRVQPRVPAAQGHEPREHQVLPEQGRRVDGRGAPASPRSPGDHDPHRTELGSGARLLHSDPLSSPSSTLQVLFSAFCF